jgi:hypothetical protein
MNADQNRKLGAKDAMEYGDGLSSTAETSQVASLPGSSRAVWFALFCIEFIGDLLGGYF